MSETARRQADPSVVAVLHQAGGRWRGLIARVNGRTEADGGHSRPRILATRETEPVGDYGLEDWLAGREEVEAILPNWSVEMRLEGWPAQIRGFADHATYRDHWPLLEARKNAWDRLRAGNAALVSEQLARRLDIALGDTLRQIGRAHV